MTPIIIPTPVHVNVSGMSRTFQIIILSLMVVQAVAYGILLVYMIYRYRKDR